MTLVVDTGGLLSILDDNQDDHERFLDAVQTHRGALVVSPLVLAELDHLILDRYGREAELTALEEIKEAYEVQRFSNTDLAKARGLCAQYADLKSFDLTDASCVVLAERYDTLDILTTDTRDFRIVLGPRKRPFRILPYDL